MHYDESRAARDRTRASSDCECGGAVLTCDHGALVKAKSFLGCEHLHLQAAEQPRRLEVRSRKLSGCFRSVIEADNVWREETDPDDYALPSIF